MGRLGAKSDYESLRDARISENLASSPDLNSIRLGISRGITDSWESGEPCVQARMEMLGLLRCAEELSNIASASGRAASGSARPRKTPRPRVVSMTPLRRSSRLTAATPTGSASTCRRSARLNGDSVTHKALPSKGSLSKLAAAAAAMEDEMEDDEEEEKATVVVDKKRVEALQERRCDSRGRGGVYDPVLGICCHFCRYTRTITNVYLKDHPGVTSFCKQKKLCGEEDCKRCGEGDLKQPCLEMEEVRKNKNWMCPHCIEEKGIKKFWICNSSFCLKKRKIAPTGIAIYDARKQGYESVAHLLMDRLKRQGF
ncbi:hypothetical protein EJB05_04897 [Eragrostis curvula]|uniref:Zinc-finger domain-containing protein n=1 Tax=Eragrostis curvula TaxID=38414 RepID=A0A5J9WDD4_9POAL|nr:hypothetical protein EJB05_04897 [Eragrostis curvula]